MKTRSLVATIALTSTALLASLPARAGDGVIEINQGCVTGTHSCFASGRTGFPVLLEEPGSYRLTSDLVVPDANTGAIRMYKGSTLDLGGFSVRGPTTCTGMPAVCTGTGFGIGILVFEGYATIRNGRVSGFGEDGIRGNEGLRVENVVLESNGDDGIDAPGAGVQIVGCTALRNGSDGFYGAYVGGNLMLLGNTAHGNGNDGFSVSNALLLDNTAHQNGVRGVNANGASSDSAVARNVGGSNGNLAAGNQVTGGYHFGPNVCGTVACP